MMCDRIAPVTLPRVSKKITRCSCGQGSLCSIGDCSETQTGSNTSFHFSFSVLTWAWLAEAYWLSAHVSPLKLHAAEALLLNWIRRTGKLWASSRRSMQLGEKPLETLQIVQSDMFKRTRFGVLTLSGWRLIHAPQWQNHRMQNQVIDKLVDLEREW